MRDMILDALNLVLCLVAFAGMVVFLIGAGCVDHPSNQILINTIMMLGVAMAFGAMGLRYVINELRREI